MQIFNDITKLVGNTPLIKFRSLGKDLPGEVLLKLEYLNPLGSVTDRIGLNMIETAEKEGKLRPGMEIVEPTSGNTGISLAFVCCAKRYPLTLVMPESIRIEIRTLLLMLGAKIILTPRDLHMQGPIAKAKELAANNPNIFIPNQYENASNIDIHRKTTALEIWNDTDGRVDIFVAGVGTGGTITGVGEALKAKKLSIKIVGVEPTESPVLSGGKHQQHHFHSIGQGFISKVMNTKILDEVETVSSDEALEMARKIICDEGIPVGISSAAAIVASLRIAAREENRGKVIVTIVGASAERDLSSTLAREKREIAKNLPVSEVDEKYLDEFRKRYHIEQSSLA